MMGNKMYIAILVGCWLVGFVVGKLIQVLT